MLNITETVFQPTLSYMPHGQCYLWETPLVGLHVVSDTLIALAYFSIPVVLLYFISRSGYVRFRQIFFLFGAFIILCGIGHLLEVWTLWHPDYWISGIEEAATALVSCYTAGSMVVLVPEFLALKSPEELANINQKLEVEVEHRKQVEAALCLANDTLEKRVQERTLELERINQTLEAEIETRKATETALRQSEKQERENAQALGETVQRLDKTQFELVRAEKMAFLGFSVAIDLLCIANTDGYLLGLNSQWEETLGYPISELEGAKFIDYIHPDDVAETMEALQQLSTGQYVSHLVNRYRTHDGSYCWLEWRASASGKLIYAAARDISDRKRTEAQVNEMKQRLQLATTSARIGIWDWNLLNDDLIWDDRMFDLYQLDPNSVNRANLLEAWKSQVHPQDWPALQERLDLMLTEGGELHEEFRALLPDGRIRHIETHALLLWNGNTRERMIGVNWDISDRKQAQAQLQQANEQLEQLAKTDPLTHLPNRRQFDRRLEQAWQNMHREQQSLTAIMVDVDYFKRYNDCYGHPEGDDCLIQLAQALQRAVRRATDFVARYGGEEFVLLLPYTDSFGAIKVAEQIQAEISRLQIPHETSEVSDRITTSIGIAATVPPINATPVDLIDWADQALYWAKEEGRNRYALFKRSCPIA